MRILNNLDKQLPPFPFLFFLLQIFLKKTHLWYLGLCVGEGFSFAFYGLLLLKYG